ncbi:MAG: putative addiction module antidote protein [Campylobacteraceae bacterium]|jgi:probable addiction module antidote protein|nr:putative addiction module antidote protein [Campylobacteraceae bacterium]
MKGITITAEDARLTPFDTDMSQHLTNNEMIEWYLNEVLERGNKAEFKRALGYIAKAKGMTTVSKEINVNRESLYKFLNGERSVGIDTVFKLLRSFGFTLKVASV